MVGEPPASTAQEPFVEALAARDGRIVALGTWAQIQPWVDANTVVHDLQGAAAVPGLVDAHAHMRNLGRVLHTIDLVGTSSFAEVIARIQEVAATTPPGTWIRGRGWDQNDWPVPEFPDHRLLSEAVADHPVWIRRVDGHAALANAMALRLAGIDANTKAPAGGRILRHADGSPTGVFIDQAEALVEHVLPAVDLQQRVQWFRSAMQHMLTLGLTGMHDAGATREQVDTYRWMLQRDELPVRVYVMHDARADSDDNAAVQAALQMGPVPFDPRGRLALRAVKFAMDGALGSRGAALLEPYNDEPNMHGLMQYSPEELQQLFLPLHRAGFQIAVHAIGDAANRLCLDAFAAIQAVAPRQDARHRIEHAQVVAAADLERFALLQVIPSIQPTHCTSDMPWAPRRLGPQRLGGAYAWRALRNTGVILPAGSDAPVESINPLWGIYAAVTRQTMEGQPPEGWSPEQRLSRSEALRGFTIWAAMASFSEADLGTLEVGKWLDLSVFTEDLLQCFDAALLGARTSMTVVGATIEYEAR
jgi:predicted amidohydrolase YtcJ